MNRRNLVASTVNLVPGVALFRGQNLEFGPSEAIADHPSGDFAALRASRNTEEVVMELLQLCLERIGWPGDVSDWEIKLDEALDCVQSRLSSENNPMLLHATGLQMDCLKRLCRFASAGDEAQTLLSALLLCDAFLPFDHWLEDGSLTGKHDKLTELARRHPETHALLGDSTERIPLQELERQIKSWGLEHWCDFIQTYIPTK